MLLPKFKYQRPGDLSEALQVLDDLGGEAKPLAGGTDLLVNLKHGNISPRMLVDLAGLAELRGLASAKGRLSIGAFTRVSEAAESRKLRGPLSVLAQGASKLGSPQVRNRATVGGNVCTARPAADLAPPLLVLGAEAVLAGPGGERRLPLPEFFMGPGQTSMQPGEILLRLEMDRPGAGSGGGYQKLGLRKALEISLVNAAAFISLGDDGRTIKKARVALGAVAPVPMRAPAAEKALLNKKAGPRAFALAAQAAADEARPISDHRGSAQYRREMVKVLVGRALDTAWQNARGK